MAVPPPHFDDESRDPAPGGLLGELERRQDDVLAQLDDLDAKLDQVLKGLEPGGSGELVDIGDIGQKARPGEATDVADTANDDTDDWGDLPDSAEDWA